MNQEIKFLSIDVGYNDESEFIISTYVKNKFLRIDKRVFISKTTHHEDVAEEAVKLFGQYNCDYFVADGMGSEMSTIDHLSRLVDVVKIINYKSNTQNINNAIMLLINDINRNRLIFTYDNKEFAEVYKSNGNFIHIDTMGFHKISYDVDKNFKRILQMLIKIYSGIYNYENGSLGLFESDKPSKMISFFKSGTELSELSLKVAKNFGNLHINTERGEGSTYACLIGAIVDAMKVGYTNVGIITPYQTMYKIMLRHITDIIESDDIFKKNIYKLTNDAVLFKNGSKIEFISPYNSPRHHRLDVVYVDMYEQMDKDKVYFIINGCQNPKVVIFENVSEEIFNLKFTKIE